MLEGIAAGLPIFVMPGATSLQALRSSDATGVLYADQCITTCIPSPDCDPKDAKRLSTSSRAVITL